MPNSVDYETVFEDAREAIDEDQFMEILERVTDGDYDGDAVAALHGVMAEEFLAVSAYAIHRARDQGESLTADHVREVTEERHTPTYPPPSSMDEVWP